MRREEGEVATIAAGAALRLISSSRGAKRRDDPRPIADRSGTLAPTTEQRRVIAKPVEVRHSPATVTVASSDGSPVADPAARARSFERKGEAGRCDPPADVPPTSSS